MNPDVKAKWVAALRSGDYVQGVDYLRGSDDRYCCLGVLCDLAVTAGLLRPGTVSGHAYAFGPEDQRSTLPASVALWAGLDPTNDSAGPLVTIGGEWRFLANHNDDHQRTFAEIADAIEAQL